MATKFLQTILKWRNRSSKKRNKNSGFTILELLVATLIATFVIVALLDLVVDLLQTDRREYARNETQREIQMALDFMVNDIREAAYIYDNNGLSGGGPDRLPGIINHVDIPAGYTPILAFWKPETISDADMRDLRDCRQFGPPSANNPNRTECDLLLIRRRAFSLVIYMQKVNDTTDANGGWKGVSRIARLHIPKYTLNGVRSLTRTNGYTDPQENTVKFATWPFDGSGRNLQAGSRAQGTTQVLVDFVDYPTQSRTSPLYSDNLRAPDNPQCPDNVNYSQIPPSNSTFNRPSFMVCVSTNNTTGTGSDRSNANQDVLIFLRGNPTGKAGVKVAPLLAVRTQAVARGVVDKQQGAQ